jgi:hypothetical protein
MPLNTAEGIQDALAGLGIGQAILAAVQALPPKATRKVTDYGPILDIVKDQVLPLVDKIEADIAS